MNIEMKNFFVQVLFFLAGTLFFPFDILAQSVFVSVPAVMAGETNSVRVSGLLGQEEIGLSLIRPDQTKILFSATADELGVVTTNIFGLHLKMAGEYRVKVQRSFAPKDFIVQSFEVLPGIVSAYRSKINIKTPSVVADGEAKSFFTLKFRDVYGNFIVGKSVKVFSSRNEDLIVAHGLSDKYGEVFGSIQSKTPGVSVISVLVDDVLLFDKPEVVFYLSDTAMENVGASDFGRFLKAQLMSDEGFDGYVKDVEYFSIEDLGSEVFSEKNHTFRIIAKDEDGNVAKNYTGTVRFVSSDAQADLPADYAFEKDDQGVHTFALAVRFDRPGQHTFKVHDLDDYSIMAEKSLMVVEENGTVVSTKENFIKILTPKAGLFKSSRMTITGELVGVDFLRIEDGPIVLVEDLEVESDGSFVFQTPALSDGVHKFRASNEDGSLVSNIVTIEVDQSAPEVLLVEIDPVDGVNPGDVFQVKVSSSEPLSSARCVFMEESVEFEAVGDKFVGGFQAPQRVGDYPLSCSISDLLGNERVEPNASVLRVFAENEVFDVQDMDGDMILDQDEFLDDDKDGVPNFLESSIFDSNQNGVVDQQDPQNDTDGDGVSNIVTFDSGVLPFDVILFQRIGAMTDYDGDGILDKDEIADLDKDLVADVLESNEMGFHNDASNDFDGGGLSNQEEIAHGTNVFDPADDRGNVIPTSVSNLSARSGDGKITLFWSPAKDDKAIFQYQVEFGTSENKFGQLNLVPDNRTQWYVDKLKSGEKYFFRVVALDAEGKKSVPSNVIEATTLGESLHSSAPERNPKSGGSSYFPFLLSLFVGVLFLGAFRRS